MKRKIAVITGTRAEYGLLFPILKKIQASNNLQLNLIVTGTHLSRIHGKTINEIKKDGFKIYKTIELLPKKDTNYEMSLSVGRGIILFSQAFKKMNPHLNLVFGDRDEMLASAIAAYHMNIPVAHIHGGDRTAGGIDEYNRHAITKMSNIHFAGSKKSYARIIKMGENPKYVFHTGSPSIDAIKDGMITPKNELEKKYKFKFLGNELLLLYHPITTQSELSKKEILAILDAILKFKKPTIAIAPNSDAGRTVIFETLQKYSKTYDFIKIYINLPRADFLGFLKNCKIFLGNSSSGMIEASYFNTPVINIGIRQKGRESGLNIINVEPSSAKIFQILKQSFNHKTHFIQRNIYGSGNASKQIVKHLETIKLDKKLIKKQIYY